VAKCRYGLVDSAFSEMKTAEIADRVRIVRLDLERTHEGAEGLLMVPQRHHDESQFVMQFVVVRLDGDGLAQAIRCGPLIASPVGNPSKLDQSTDVARIAVEHLPD
jgi:hypothetical protein